MPLDSTSYLGWFYLELLQLQFLALSWVCEVGCWSGKKGGGASLQATEGRGAGHSQGDGVEFVPLLSFCGCSFAGSLVHS